MLYKRYTAEFKGITVNYCMDFKKNKNYIMEFFHLRSFFAKSISCCFDTIQDAPEHPHAYQHKAWGSAIFRDAGDGEREGHATGWGWTKYGAVAVWVVTSSLLHGAPACHSRPFSRPRNAGIRSAQASPEIRFLVRTLFLAGTASEVEKCPH